MRYPGVRFGLPPRSSSLKHFVELGSPYAEPWLQIRDAITLIMTRQDVGPETAVSKLREGCLSGKVRSRHLLACISETGEKVIKFRSLPANVWSWWNGIDLNSEVLHTLDLGRVELVGINELDLAAWLARPRRGPAVGEVARYADLDRALLDSVTRIMRDKAVSVEEAARDLAYTGQVAGRGTPDSRAKRLARLYRKQRPHRR